MRRPLAWIVNSSSFGRVFPEHLRKLQYMCEVRRVDGLGRVPGRELARRLRGATVVIASVSPEYGPDFFRAMPGLKLVARHGIGYDNVDVAAASRAGVLVTKVPGPVEREAMAEAAVSLLLMVMRRFVPAGEAVRAGRWAERTRFVGREIAGKTVGIIGCGNIGSRVAEMLRRGFGARVLARDPKVSSERILRLGAEPFSLARLLAESDIICLHADLNPTSRNILSAAALRKTKPGVFIVNMARGEETDEKALARGLRNGRIAGLGLDTVASEPAGRNHPLLRCPNVALVPHIGAYTAESLRAMGEKVLDDVARVLAGKRPKEIVIPSTGRSRGK
jgi:phosphoglycerate dehydrogenase-like enzyme